MSLKLHSIFLEAHHLVNLSNLGVSVHDLRLEEYETPAWYSKIRGREEMDVNFTSTFLWMTLRAVRTS